LTTYSIQRIILISNREKEHKMKKQLFNFTVEVRATDWCGYDSEYEIMAESEDAAAELAELEFIDEWDLLKYTDGNWGEPEDFDEEGDPIDDDSLTSITTNVLMVEDNEV
jgi:hypothetical protein